ncbi:hypothetical protein ZIOFF_004264 [Zingiber officinale]|uniref:AAA+ ATPase At3g28540-like C-terminal domain-containing protein n=1 Tax=Zingiber officinale TaxID=94328 RepID=A0A8J5HYV5_ZINOF|nr:hypothetical protein ZIOFF_004264 [Zingiber officinale]
MCRALVVGACGQQVRQSASARGQLPGRRGRSGRLGTRRLALARKCRDRATVDQLHGSRNSPRRQFHDYNGCCVIDWSHANEQRRWRWRSVLGHDAVKNERQWISRLGLAQPKGVTVAPTQSTVATLARRNYLEAGEAHPWMLEVEALLAEVEMTPADIAQVFMRCNIEGEGTDAAMN